MKQDLEKFIEYSVNTEKPTWEEEDQWVVSLLALLNWEAAMSKSISVKQDLYIFYDQMK